MHAPTHAPLYLVDASLYVFRAWHAADLDAVDAEGQPAGAVHGFARFLLEFLERQRPVRMLLAFDEALRTGFRNALFPAYKANRPPPPDDLRRQFAHCQALCRALGLTVLADTRYEGDDLIGSALARLRTDIPHGVIVSADKDLSQLLVGDDEQWDYARNLRWRAHEVKARYGVHAHQIADYLGLTGDAIDNIPGVPGIGAKTAAVLLAHFGSLDALLDRIDEVPYLRLRGAATCAERLRTHRAQALLSRQLATLALDAPLPEDFGGAERRPADAAALDALMEQVRFGPMSRRRLREAAAL
ncbi:5'-3' exonuclease [Coralloluteibacterium thermophilus]|uniref:5'-3' exonuclease H3TH domain-containing protein n=1 Tax=Coralloluteibacterium thermophilum TaxID=2707049 RepID=A0ABV9NHR8_9GAMM